MLLKAVRSLRTWIVLLAAVWITAVIMMISSQPERGAASVQELAERVTDALRAADSERLAEVVSLAEGAEDAAQATVSGFAEAGVSEISTKAELLRGRMQLTVSYLRPDGGRGTLHLPTVHADNRWQVTPIPLP
ncbi:hypothetical protein N8J89_36465 [Crossiella sp. CA-258035]|uniref:hypothetical protein n=1 Tax=Crossiella sp. CA-258035 TaxID=2981138 RepID=UPI0024BC01FC|nr:hypothetical protein [Crossiella sp. CA-258035]WHT18545.1 hypothetical protein N8J89_36465 [Crossiella sp. CA-258035]